jgi:manganese/iron transport system permease protein
VAQTLIFLTAFVFAPKHGLLAARRRAREALAAGVVAEVPGVTA